MRRPRNDPRREWRRRAWRGWIARAEDVRTNGLVRDELQAICERREVGSP